MTLTKAQGQGRPCSRERGGVLLVPQGFDMRNHLRPLFPLSISLPLWVCGSFPFSAGIFGVPEQQGLWELAKVNECSSGPLFFPACISSQHNTVQHTGCWKPQQSDHYPCSRGRWHYPVAFCLMSFGNADNAKAPHSAPTLLVFTQQFIFQADN